MDDFYVFGGIFGAVFTLIFIVAFVLIITRLVQGIGTWNRNNHSPKQTVSAVLGTQRHQHGREYEYRVFPHLSDRER